MDYLTNSDFYKSASCNKAKEHDTLISAFTADLTQNEKANATKIFASIAKMWLRQHPDFENDETVEEEDILTNIGEISDIVNAAYLGSTGQECTKAEEVNLKELSKGITRYCRDEKRFNDKSYHIMLDQTLYVSADDTPEIAAVYQSLKDKPVKIHFDVIFVSKTMGIEGICYKGGKPWIKDKEIEQDLWLNLMLIALEKLVPAGEHRMVRAGYYFMRERSDKPGVAWDFRNFFEGSNVVRLEEMYANTPEYKATKTLDKDLVDAYKVQFEGTECSEEDCAKCKFNALCNGKVAPQEMQQKQQKRGKKVTPSDAQQAIIDWNNGILAVIAGAGAGKTECVSEHVVSRILDYLKKDDATKVTNEEVKNTLHKFLMTTFTNAGANEMKDRVLGKLASRGIFANPEDIMIVTFNTFAFDICKQFYQELGFKRVPRVIDNIRFSRIAVNLLNETPVRGLDYEHFNVDMPNCKGGLAILRTATEKVKTARIDMQASDAASQVKSLLHSYGRFITDDAFADDFVDFYNDLQKQMYEDGLMLFADQEPMALKVLGNHPNYLEEQGFERIIIDEAQDSNEIQMEFIKLLSSTSCFKSMVVVGDDFQAIYSFRETSPEYLVKFDQMIGKSVTFQYLTDNYRSTPEILEVANKFIAANKEQLPKKLASAGENGRKPSVLGFYEKDEEYMWIVDRIKAKIDEGYLPEEIAILARTNPEIEKLGALLTQAGIPIVMKNPTPYLANLKVMGAMALRNAIFAPEITQNYFEYLSAKNPNLFEEMTDNEILDAVDEMKGIFSSLVNEDLDKQRAVFHSYLDALRGNDEIYDAFLELVYDNEDFPSEIQYMSDFSKYGQDEKRRMEQSYQGVVLSTAHSSKGLEWPVVFVTISKWDTIECHKRTASNGVNKDLEESRRLLYVAMTRARKELYVTSLYTAFGNAKDGVTYNQFLKELYDIVGNVFMPIDPDAQIKKLAKENAAAQRKVLQASKEARKTMMHLLAKCNGDPSKLSKARPEKGGKKGMSDAEIYEYNKLIVGQRQMTVDDWIESDERFS